MRTRKNNTRKREDKRSKIRKVMVNRYNFYKIFGVAPATGDIYPLFNMRVNGIYYRQFYSIPKGPSFGGIDIYQYMGRDFSGTWDSNSKVLTLVGIL